MSSYYRDERDYDRPPRRAAETTEVLVRERDRDRDREDRTPAFLRGGGGGGGRAEAGPMVLRRPRSPSPAYREERVVEERIMRRRGSSPSPVPAFRRRRSPSRGRDVSVERRVHIRRDSSFSSYSSSPERVPARRGLRGARPRSVSPDWKETEVTVVKRQHRSPSPRPAPPPPQPEVIRGPTVEREVITHYTDIDHGVVVARPPSPKPHHRGRSNHRDTEIDIYTSRNETEVDIHTRDHSHSHARRPSRARSRSRHDPHHHHHGGHHDELVVVDRSRLLTVDHHQGGGGRRRAHSAAPLPVRAEAREIEGRIDARGRMGEAYGGATRDWTIVDVPPGTERVHMDGVGGGSAEVNWSRYSGVRRTRFNPEPSSSGALVPVGRPAAPSPRSSGNELSVHVHSQHHHHQDRRPSRTRGSDMWTEISRDLVSREAVRKLGYPFEETRWFIYIMEYLRHEDVQQLVALSTDLRRSRRLRARQQAVSNDIDVHIHKHRHGHGHSPHPPFAHEDRRYVEREVIIDQKGYRY